MIGSKKAPQKTRTAEVDTLIGRGTTLKGDLTFEGCLHVEGTIIGNVRCASGDASMLILSESGVIEGDIEVPNMIIDGAVTGDVYAAAHAELAPKARIKGNVYYKTIEMATGAQINGNLVYREEIPQVSKPVELLPNVKKKAEG